MSTSSDHGDAGDPTQLREEVEQELQEMTEEASEEEAQRMAQRKEAGVDEPSGEE